MKICSSSDALNKLHRMTAIRARLGKICSRRKLFGPVGSVGYVNCKDAVLLAVAKALWGLSKVNDISENCNRETVYRRPTKRGRWEG